MNLILKNTAILLWILLTLFVCRVLGQLTVLLFAPSFLPPMEDWYSGLMPYGLLLPSQLIIISVFSKINLDITHVKGYFARPNHRMGLWLKYFGVIYFLGMIVRFIIQGISIPVVFHWILATYILVFGNYHIQYSKFNTR
mgnify:CR=1 FL=1